MIILGISCTSTITGITLLRHFWMMHRCWLTLETCLYDHNGVQDLISFFGILNFITFWKLSKLKIGITIEPRRPEKTPSQRTGQKCKREFDRGMEIGLPWPKPTIITLLFDQEDLNIMLRWPLNQGMTLTETDSATSRWIWWVSNSRYGKLRIILINNPRVTITEAEILQPYVDLTPVGNGNSSIYRSSRLSWASVVYFFVHKWGNGISGPCDWVCRRPEKTVRLGLADVRQHNYS